MLILVKDPRELRYSQLMEVYRQELLQTARERFGNLPADQAVTEAEQELYAYITRDLLRTRNALCAFWAPEGVYRSAARLEPYEDGYLLTGICTAPDYLRRGYACSLLRQLISILPADTRIYSHVEKTNAPSAALHAKCGFIRILDHGRMLDGSVLHNFWTFFLGK